MIADFQRDYLTKMANYDQMVNTAKAESDLAYELQQSKERQVIVDELLKVDLVEKQGLIKVEEKEILRAEKYLTASTRLPADAKAYETKIQAEGRRFQRMKKAEGDAQRIRLLGSATASSLQAVSNFSSNKRIPINNLIDHTGFKINITSYYLCNMSQMV